MSFAVMDQMGREVIIPAKPQRIISLVPSQTELLFDLGLEELIAGITKFCIHPANKVKSKPKIGGTKQFKLELIDHLQPDLIIGNKEENYQEGINALAQKYPVWMSDITDLDSALDMIRSVGIITQTEALATEMAAQIADQFNTLPHFSSLRAAYFIWKDPWMAAGQSTFINEMLKFSGFSNVFTDLSGRYPEIPLEMLKKVNPEIVLLSSEPYPFKEKHIAELNGLLPDSKILLVDGELFSWYGSRLLKTPEYLKQLREKITP